ncbi:hypothetical protein [Lacinutrix neustonica]|uniref:hypothetical protein n=1 Tax=Lacinutrix neustonica TaxID=2980107 RepID=UPI0028BD3295|nr:hypothetical protein [Lacinutrix neustonica]
MSDLIEDIKYKLARLNILEKLIVVNVGVFLFGLVFRRIIPGVFRYFELPRIFLMP